MLPSLTPEDEFVRGAVYFLDRTELGVTCSACGRFFIDTVQPPTLKCPDCGAEFGAEAAQLGFRPYVIVASEELLDWDNTVLAVPLTTSHRAARRPGAVRIQPSPENGLEEQGFALTAKVVPVNKTSFFKERRSGELDVVDMERVEQALRDSLGL